MKCFIAVSMLFPMVGLAAACEQLEAATECTRPSDCEVQPARCDLGVCKSDGAVEPVAELAETNGGDSPANVGDGHVSPFGRERHVLEVTKDTYVRADDFRRRDDNYGCERGFVVARGRGRSGEFPTGAPGATETYLYFDLAGITEPVLRARLVLTVNYLEREFPIVDMPLDVHRISSSKSRTPWSEGNGTEVEGQCPYGCAWVDDAYGVAWMANGNMVTAKPDIDETVYARTVVPSTVMMVDGDNLQFDITTLVNEWIVGANSNHGLAIIASGWGESFHSISFGSSEGEREDYFDKDGNLYPKTIGPRLYLYTTR